MSGSLPAEQDGRAARLRPGEFTIYDFTRPYELAYDSAVQLAVFGFPREMLALPRIWPARLTAVPIAADGEPARWPRRCSAGWPWTWTVTSPPARPGCPRWS